MLYRQRAFQTLTLQINWQLTTYFRSTCPQHLHGAIVFAVGTCISSYCSKIFFSPCKELRTRVNVQRLAALIKRKNAPAGGWVSSGLNKAALRYGKDVGNDADVASQDFCVGQLGILRGRNIFLTDLYAHLMLHIVLRLRCTLNFTSWSTLRF